MTQRSLLKILALAQHMDRAGNAKRDRLVAKVLGELAELAGSSSPCASNHLHAMLRLFSVTDYRESGLHIDQALVAELWHVAKFGECSPEGLVAIAYAALRRSSGYPMAIHIAGNIDHVKAS